MSPSRVDAEDPQTEDPRTEDPQTKDPKPFFLFYSIVFHIGSLPMVFLEVFTAAEDARHADCSDNRNRSMLLVQNPATVDSLRDACRKTPAES